MNAYFIKRMRVVQHPIEIGAHLFSNEIHVP